MKTLATLSLLLLFPFAAGCATPSKSELDAEVKRLCAIDGGIKVYETVKLPAERFNQWGQINFFRPTLKENALGPEYLYEWNVEHIQKGNPALNGPQEIAVTRDHIKIMRRVDKKLLGEVVTYHRAGGDLPGPWMPSSFRCPDIRESNEVVLMQKVFSKSGEEARK